MSETVEELKNALREKEAAITSLKISVKNLEADLTASQREVARLKSIFEPGTSEAIIKGMFELAEEYGHKQHSSRHALTFFRQKLEKFVHLQAENASLQQENERLKAQVQGAQTLADEKCRCFLERAQKAETLLRELAEALKADYNTFTQAAQLIDGWNATEAEWSEWDRSVRTMITDCMVKARAALARAEEVLK